MKKEYTINHIKKWSENGTCYKQTVNIKQKTFDKLKDILKTELIIPTNDDYYSQLYLKSRLIQINNIVFMNLTQRDFFNKYLKLKLSDQNTCFCIIE